MKNHIGPTKMNIPKIMDTVDNFGTCVNAEKITCKAPIPNEM